MKRILLFFYGLSLPLFVIGQLPSAQNILEKSIQYHDPAGQWGTGMHWLSLRETRPDSKDRFTTCQFNLLKSSFEMNQTREEDKIVRGVQNDQCTHQLNGSSTLTKEQVKKHRLDCPRTKLLRDYYIYLWGLPMKLKDPGTQISETVQETSFQDKDCYALKVTYDPEVGEDIWYFYFDKSTFAMIGYRFYHEEAKNDGEYITLQGETMVGKMRLPKTRNWYINKDDRFLGADILEEGRFTP